MKAEVLIQADNLLGEGPVWDYRTNELLWVDIENKLLNFCDIRNGDLSQIEMDCRISTVVLCASTDNYLLALENGLKIYNRKTRELKEIAHPEAGIINNRFNDGKCDPSGRFWVGSMNLNAEKGKGKLYCLDKKNSIETKLDQLTISNGLCWNVVKKQMYFIDTADHNVKSFDFNLESGAISNPKIAVTIPATHGAPDGICIDSAGMLWIAHWGGGNVSSWHPESGELLAKIAVPAPHVTSCCFGGTNLDTLYITTARMGLNKNQLKQYPLSGSVFFAKPGVKGLKPNIFQY